jgi:hypothetical protein
MNQTAIQTGRNPFAHFTIGKRRIYGKSCTWCGTANDLCRPYVWQYYVDADSRRESGDIAGMFCSIGCLNSYYS